MGWQRWTSRYMRRRGRSPPRTRIAFRATANQPWPMRTPRVFCATPVVSVGSKVASILQLAARPICLSVPQWERLGSAENPLLTPSQSPVADELQPIQGQIPTCPQKFRASMRSSRNRRSEPRALSMRPSIDEHAFPLRAYGSSLAAVSTYFFDLVLWGRVVDQRKEQLESFSFAAGSLVRVTFYERLE